MDILTNKTTENYDYTSRYTVVPYYYNTLDNKYIYGIGSQMFKNVSYVAYKTLPTDTLDSLSLKYYGNPTYYWVIAFFNDILDCYDVDLSVRYPTLKIPNLSSITFGDER